ncbi:hypothetical protein G9A89_003330 [Geosiphon pyriformis]|nr:hypothetical protein G9A89_003330 [Geosiphon pyriformis]
MAVSSSNSSVAALQNFGVTLYDAFLARIFNYFCGGVPKDLTYGRASLGYSPTEQIFRTEPYKHQSFKVPFPFKGALEHFIHYQTWELSTVKSRHTDFIYVHGLNDYGGRFSENCVPILQQGFRIIPIDMPGHGRSSGLHSYLADWEELIESVRIVIAHVREQNASDPLYKNQRRKLILGGGSMGGFVTISYAIKYPEDIDAFSVLCPLVYVAGTSRPHKILEYLARIIVGSPLGRLPLAPAHQNKGSQNPLVSEAFFADPQTYHGNMRAQTGLALLDGITWLQLNLGRVNKPFLAQHGLNDRVCEVRSSLDLFSQAQIHEKHKTIKLYQQCEHDMLREHCGKQIIQDLTEWLVTMDEYLESNSVKKNLVGSN